jgi:hypothetical protein
LPVEWGGNGKDLTTFNDIRPLLPPGTVDAGEYHDHPSAPSFASDRFSLSDIGRANFEHIPSFLGIPSGDVFKYDPETGMQTTMAP